MKALIKFDGGCKPNPGAKYGSYSVTVDDSFELRKERFPLGFGTSNESEFESLLEAVTALLKACRQSQIDPAGITVSILTDSTIVRGWLDRMKSNGTGSSKKTKRDSVRRAAMRQLAIRCAQALAPFKSFHISWNGRENNVETFGH